MKLNLKKPLIVFDLETTGLDMVQVDTWCSCHLEKKFLFRRKSKAVNNVHDSNNSSTVSNLRIVA
mgnify:CR=1 FL=1